MEGEKLLVESRHEKFPCDCSRDGKFLVYAELNPRTKWDIWVLELTGGKPFPLLASNFSETNATFAPLPETGIARWMAYESDETGRPEIYLRRFRLDGPAEEDGPKWRVSSGGGSRPRWREDARELFYTRRGELMAVDIMLSPTPRIGSEKRLFSLPPNFNMYNYAPFADGRRFLMLPGSEPAAPARINVVLNWTRELR